jgi:outer membrane protein OmpA-like peptidoglycan-associated protein
LRTLLLFLLWSPFFWAQETFVIYFDTDKFELTPTESERLQQFLQTENITIQKIIGFCDYRASEAHNQVLSEKRAQFVYDLVKNKFTNAIPLEGKGEKFPQNPALQQNRKVEIYYVTAIPEILEKMEIVEVKKEVPTQYQNLKVGDKLVLKNLYFYNRSGVFVPKSRPVVEELLQVLLDNPKLKIEIHGHICCHIGHDPEDIAKVRAFAVYKYLIDNGVAKERLQYKSFGNTQPIHKIPEKNDTERDENRRVEILILDN